jgi:hypothetical protein
MPADAAHKIGKIDPNLTQKRIRKSRESPTIFHSGKRYKLLPHQNGWRLRSRAKGRAIDAFIAAQSLRAAKEEALKLLGGRDSSARFKGNLASLEQVIEFYKAMPKNAGKDAEFINICRLRAVCRVVYGKELHQLSLAEIGPKLWNAYFTKRLGGKLDFWKRRPENASINSAVRCASSIFAKKLRPAYSDAGIEVSENATVIQWLPEMKQPRPEAEDEKLIKAIKALPEGPMFYATGLARWAGLRRCEIAACTDEWIVEENNSVFIQLRDRPEQGFLSKTGEQYRALIIDEEFAKALLTRTKNKKGSVVETPDGMCRFYYMERVIQKWLKPFTGSSKKPLHRLRGLYADSVANITSEALTIHLAAVKAASGALGHTGIAVTMAHYLSGRFGDRQNRLAPK